MILKNMETWHVSFEFLAVLRRLRVLLSNDKVVDLSFAINNSKDQIDDKNTADR